MVVRGFTLDGRFGRMFRIMGICITRRPVFTKGMRVYGYELLYHEDGGDCQNEEVRGGTADIIDGSYSSRTIIHDFHDIGVARVTNNRRGFIRFTEKLLLDMVATVLPSEILVVELAGTITPTPEVVAACRRLKSNGYLIALDGLCSLEEASTPLINVADIIKIEFSRENQEKIRKFVLEQQKNHPNTQILAQNLETPSEFDLAKKCGCLLFQGNFYSKPTVVKNRALVLAPKRIHMLQLIRLSFDPDINYQAVSDIIKQDVALSYRLLRFINSAFFGLHYTVRNIRQALSILGAKELKKWITLVTMSGLSENKPTELIMLSLIRARFMELFAPNAGMADQADDLFLMGLMSLMDAILGMPMAMIVTQTNISTHIATPLLTGEREYGNLLNLIACYEQSDWDQTKVIAARYAVSMERVSNIYVQAIEWSQQIYAGPAYAA